MEMHLQPQYLRGLFDSKYITTTKTFLGGITLSVYDSREKFLFDATIRIGDEWSTHNLASDTLATGKGLASFVGFIQRQRMLAKFVEI